MTRKPPTSTHNDGNYTHLMWRAYNKQYRIKLLHREDGPAYIVYNTKTGSYYSLQWYVKGVYHRVDGPAYIQYDDDGNVIRVRWEVCGLNVDYLVEDWIKKHNVPVSKHCNLYPTERNADLIKYVKDLAEKRKDGHGRGSGVLYTSRLDHQTLGMIGLRRSRNRKKYYGT